jgi:hypothetical protein
MISGLLDSWLLSIFVRIGNRWFENVAFSCDPKTEQVRHMIFAQDSKWLAKTIELIEAQGGKK